MPMELGLELVPIVCPHLANAERKLFDDVVDEKDGVCLCMPLINFEGANSGCIIDSGVLETANLLAAFSFEGQKLNVNLNVMSWNLFLIALSEQFTHPRASGKPVEAVTFENAVNPSI